MRSAILSMGEAVVDVLPAEGGLWRPVPGGSSYNVALALGMLGAPAAFVGRLSRDEQGRRMVGILQDAGVSTHLISRDDRPSPLSLIERGSETESARYSIHLVDTAHAPPDLPSNWLDGAAHLHVSSFSAIVGEWGRAVGAALDATEGRATRSLDVNIRPGLIPPPLEAAALIAERVRQVEIVKASEEDISWLFRDRSPDDVAADWSRSGPVAIVTRGGAGASVFVDGAPIHRGGRSVAVVDTVGAGDTFMAAFMAEAVRRGVLANLRAASPDEITALLDVANAAAALCCARAGANPPSRADVDAFIETSRSSR